MGHDRWSNPFQNRNELKDHFAPAPKVWGVFRMADNPKALGFAFDRRLTDGEMRFLHEVMERSVHLLPSEKETP